jgi:hypothetical protein
VEAGTSKARLVQYAYIAAVLQEAPINGAQKKKKKSYSFTASLLYIKKTVHG